MNLTTIGVGKPALELGSLIHAALAEWNIDTSVDLQDHFKVKSAERIVQVKETYKKVNGVRISPVELDPLYESIALGLAMMANYQKRWSKPLPDNMVFASMEQEIIVDITGTEHQCPDCNGLGFKVGVCEKCNGTGITRHQLRATLDGLIHDNRGVYFVLERKTYGNRPDLTGLENNDQFIGYTWVLRETKLGPIGGVAYDGMWKRADVPKGKKFEDLFIRTNIQYTHAQLDEWGSNLAAQINEISAGSAIYTNRRWEGCGDCPFEKLCTTQSRGEDYEWYIKTHYTQREDNRPRGVVGLNA